MDEIRGVVMNDNEIKDSLYDLYNSYNHHKKLFQFYQSHKSIKSENDIRERINYIAKNKVKQKSEIETLLWVLGEKINDIDNKTKDIA